jgi:hypothetical protein
MDDIRQRHALAGVTSEGLKTTVLPKASAEPIFRDGIAIGKFHGVITPITPIGSRPISTPTFGCIFIYLCREAACHRAGAFQFCNRSHVNF